MKLTTAIARSLELSNGKIDQIKWDDDLPGFGVRLRAGYKVIKRTWIYQYDLAGRTRRLTIGYVSAMGIEDARKIAGQHQSKVRLGEDPAKQKAEKIERATNTFISAFGDFLEVKRRTTRRWHAMELVFTKNCKALFQMSLPAITRRDIADVLTRIAARGKQAQANNVRGKLITFFNWAIKQGRLESNPVLATEKYETKSRERVLSMAELVAISKALVELNSTVIHLLKPRLNMIDYSDMIHLLMLTGQRLSEISELQWSELRTEEIFIDEGLPVAGPAIVLPSERTKNGHRHIVPLSKPAQAILSSRQRDKELVFPRKLKDQAIWNRKWSDYKKILDATLVERGHKLEHWVLHDLRRSAATHMRQQMGIQRDTIEEVLNHYRANVYIKGELERAKRQALEAWGEFLMAHIEGRTPADKVVPIRA